MENDGGGESRQEISILFNVGAYRANCCLKELFTLHHQWQHETDLISGNCQISENTEKRAALEILNGIWKDRIRLAYNSFFRWRQIDREDKHWEAVRQQELEKKRKKKMLQQEEHELLYFKSQLVASIEANVTVGKRVQGYVVRKM